MRFASAMARCAAETVKLEAQTKGNPAASISFALMASWAPTAIRHPGSLRRSRSRPAFVIVAPLRLKALVLTPTCAVARSGEIEARGLRGEPQPQARGANPMDKRSAAPQVYVVVH